MRRWIAGGGRLVIVGGTIGPASLAAFPDDLLPFRPDVTTDVPAADLTGLLGPLPTGATTLPAMAGELIAGRALATSGDRVVAAERAVRLRPGHAPRLRPDDALARQDRRRAGPVAAAAPGPHVRRPVVLRRQPARQAVYQLPALALPPTSG